MGNQDIVKHSRTQSHLDQAQVMTKLTFACQSLDKVLQWIAAEWKDGCSSSCFQYSMISCHPRSEYFCRLQAYHSASTKATCMLNGAVASTLKSKLLKKWGQPFSICVDGSNDRELQKQKMNAVTVWIHDDINSHIASNTVAGYVLIVKFYCSTSV